MRPVWSNAGGQPTFAVVLDWRVSACFFLLVAHCRVWTIILMVVVASTLSLLSHFGYTLPVFYNRMRARFAGDIRVSRPWWWRRRYIR